MPAPTIHPRRVDEWVAVNGGTPIPPQTPAAVQFTVVSECSRPPPPVRNTLVFGVTFKPRRTSRWRSHVVFTLALSFGMRAAMPPTGIPAVPGIPATVLLLLP